MCCADWQLGNPGNPGPGLGIGLGRGGGMGGGVGDANGLDDVGKMPGMLQTESCADANAVPSVNGWDAEPPSGPALPLGIT